MLAVRRTRYIRVSEFLASRSDVELAGLLSGDGRIGEMEGGGGSVVVDVNGVHVFAKRIPLTDLELAHPRSTANLFDLPMFCQYCFGVPKFPSTASAAPGSTRGASWPRT